MGDQNIFVLDLAENLSQDVTVWKAMDKEDVAISGKNRYQFEYHFDHIIFD